MRRIKHREADILKFSICSVLIICATLVANWNIRFRGVYLDDYGMWMGVDTTRIVDYVFSTGANKIRPIPHAVMFLMARISDMDPAVLGYLLLALHAGVSIAVFVFSLLISKNYLVSFFLAQAYQFSRFSYYHVTQFLGIMELCGLVFAIAVLLLLYNALQNKRLYSEVVCLSYFCAAFSHERYFALLPVILYAAMCIPKNKGRTKLCVQAALTFLAIVGIRILIFGNRAFDGTGGTDIKDTFSLAQAFSFAVSQVFYLLGWNAGPEYLNGYVISNYSQELKRIIICMDVCMLLVVAAILYIIIRNRKCRWQVMKTAGLFLVFIAICIGSASATIRVEMRWIYVTFTAMLLMMAYLYSVAKAEGGRAFSLFIGVLICVYGLCSCISDAELRKGKGDYYSEFKSTTDSLYDNTYAKYGDELWYKKLILIDNVGSDIATIREWMRAFPHGKLVDNLSIETYGSLRELDPSIPDENTIVLFKNNHMYHDYTENYRIYDQDRLILVSGFEESGWIEREAEFVAYTREHGEVGLILYTNQQPDESWNDRIVNIYADNELIHQTMMNEQRKVVYLQVEPNKRVNFRIENNYEDPNVVLGGKERCYILSIWP